MANHDFDQYAQNYTGRISESLSPFGQEHDFFVRRKVSILQKAFLRLAQSHRLKVLDVGCGVGLIHRYLTNEKVELHGVDVSSASLAIAESANPGVRYSSYSGEQLPYETGHFDCAFAICVLHHVPVSQWQKFVQEMQRVVRPGGLVILIEHNPYNPATQWVVHSCELDKDAVLVRPRLLAALLHRAGLRDLDMRYFLFTPFPHPIFHRLDQWISWLPLGAQYFAIGEVSRQSTSDSNASVR